MASKKVEKTIPILKPYIENKTLNYNVWGILILLNDVKRYSIAPMVIPSYGKKVLFEEKMKF